MALFLVGTSGFGAIQPSKLTRPAGLRMQEGHDWSVYDGGPQRMHYSPLTQINRSNVSQLKAAWTYDTGERGGEALNRSLETSPIIVHGLLYGLTPSQQVFALNAATGKLLWKFNSGISGTQPNRGLAYWASGKDRRILVGIMNFVYELNAETGKPIATFGRNGRIDLRDHLGRDPSSVIIALTSPGIVYKNLLIVGGLEPETLPCAPGNIRAYDVRTGKLRWSFHTIPHPGEPGYDTWPKEAWKYSGSANNWAGMALDAKRGIVYVPTGSAASDFYGANRVGRDLFADCLIALNAETGKMLWYFQDVHHDIWDRDFPSPPVLVTVERHGVKVDAVAQTTKQGFVYLFNRKDGRPLFPIKYHRYPPSDVPGEVAAKEQPLPTKPAPFARQLLSEALLTNRTPQAHQWAVDQFRKFRSAGQFVPFSVGKKTVVFPGFDGGAEWGGPAVDPQTGILYVNSNDVAWTGELAENTSHKASARGLYLRQCSVCHGDKMAGSPPDFPSLIGIGARLTPDGIARTIRHGKGRMPAFSNLSRDQLSALVSYLTSGENRNIHNPEQAAIEAKYHFTGYDKFLDPEGYPAVAPPWGTLNAINLNTGDYVWKIPLGEYPQLAAQGMANTGTENYGGPVVTAGGLVFIAAANFDDKIRAFDKSTGQLLWQATLPFAGNATPATYEVNGRQYVVIAAGGEKASGKADDAMYVAFALPRVAASQSTARRRPSLAESQRRPGALK
ncbi:MAG: PQQ-binding-like beta-propeller repeat protein [Acidobacteriota bacterium]|nr:PQQ-binding-like beta-propeller repeat protein [Acidobacteriota bacterium]